MEQKDYLTNIAIIRPVLIVLLVFYHAFAPYSGAWEPIDNISGIQTYWWLDKLAYAFMLETFVFVSGYVLGYQVKTKGSSKLNGKYLLLGKFKRLIIPCIVFSFIYILLFEDITQPIQKTLYDVVNGFGHMWFLPMLFWCFVGIWIIEKIKIKPQFAFPFLLFCSLFSFIPLPLRMNVSLYFMFFFYSGYFFQRYNIDINRIYSIRFLASLVISFFILFPILTLFRENSEGVIGVIIDKLTYIPSNQLLIKIIRVVLCNFAKIIISSIGLFMLFVAVGIIDKKRAYPPQWVINLGVLCMGVYLFQQFILKVLYYYTCIPDTVGSYWLPWIGFSIALPGSLLVSYLFHKTRIGRFFIG